MHTGGAVEHHQGQGAGLAIGREALAQLELVHARAPLLRKAAALRVHRIEGGEQLDPLDTTGSLATPRQHLLALHREGYAAADRWLLENCSHLGRRGTVDIVAEYLVD